MVVVFFQIKTLRLEEVVVVIVLFRTEVPHRLSLASFLSAMLGKQVTMRC